MSAAHRDDLASALAELSSRVELLEAMIKELVLEGPLRARSRPAPAGPSAGARTWRVVRAAGRRLGLPLEGVREVVRSVALEPIPGAPAALAGLLDLRGEPIEVIDLRVALGAAPREDDLDSRLVVVRLEGGAERASIAFEVDEALGLSRVAPDAVEPAPRLGSAAFLVGVVRPEVDGEQPLLLLEPAHLLEALVARGELGGALEPAEGSDEGGAACPSPA